MDATTTTPGTRGLLAYARHHGMTYTDDSGRVWTPEEAAVRVGVSIDDVRCICGEEEDRR